MFTFKAPALSLLVHSNSPLHRLVQEWYEGFLKDCPGGELSREKFVAMYSKIFPRLDL